MNYRVANGYDIVAAAEARVIAPGGTGEVGWVRLAG